MDSERHFDFIKNTEVKNLHSQVKKMVSQAQEVAREELLWRRNQLKKLLDFESKFYEEESGKRVKERITLGYMQRKSSLAEKREENDRREKEFIEAKRVHQHMTSCYAIRQALRRKEQMQTQACQLFQIAEHERQLAQKKDRGKYWLEVKKEHDRRCEARESSEKCLRKELSRQTKRVLDLQMEEVQRRRDKERTLRLVEQTALVIASEVQALEEAKVASSKLPSAQHYGQELRDVIAERAAIKRFKQCEEAEIHRRMVRKLQHLETADNAAAMQRKRVLRQSTDEFIEYSRHMRCFKQHLQRLRNERIDELYRVDTCTKNNLKRAMELKAEMGRQAQTVLKQQMCDQHERRLREEAERRENKILENRFVHDEPSSAEIMKLRLRNREALDKQIEELRLYHEMEKQKYESELMRAVDDPEYCDAFMERYMRDGVDYLPPHHNWKIIGCPIKNYLGERVGNNAYKECKAEVERETHSESCIPQKRRYNFELG